MWWSYLEVLYVGEWAGIAHPLTHTFIGKGKEYNDEMD
jgi:hypothetical protein